MVTLRRALIVVLATTALLLGPIVGAHAQQPAPPVPTQDPGTSSSFGFDQVCNQIKDELSKSPMFGSLGTVFSGLCKAGNVATHPDDTSNTVKSGLWDSTFAQITQGLLDGLGQALAWTMTFWLHLPNDKLLDSQTLWAKVDSYTRILQIWLLGFSIAISAVRIGLARRHLASEQAEETFRMLARSTATTWIAGTAILAASRMSDSFSDWLVRTSVGTDATGTAELFVKNLEHSGGLLAPGFIFVVAIIGVLGSLAMIAMTILRQALLVVAVGVYPLTAAASGMSGGRQSYQRLGSWIIAFLLFKPCAGLVYMIAFTTADTSNAEASYVTSQDSAMRALIGLVLLCSTAFVLPALVRLVNPALAVLGSGGSGAAAAGTVAGLGAAALAGRKALLARGATAGTVSQALGGGNNGPRPPGNRGGGGGGGGGGGSPALPPARPGPSGREITAGPTSGGAGASSARVAGSSSMRARGTGVGRSTDRVVNDTTGNRRGPTPPTPARRANPNPNLGPNQIDR